MFPLIAGAPSGMTPATCQGVKRLSATQRTRARRLRRDQTDAEARLWSHLRSRRLAQAKFRRQQPLGKFVVDFCCMELGLVIEVDGGQHAQQEAADGIRTDCFRRDGWRVLRFWNHEVLEHLQAVLEQIRVATEEQRGSGRRYGMRDVP